ncbi:hypothetical protein RN001_013683 [Aquatica leii]|uniref:Uncharacterized protein n=1 Tax=Aquatica leii TaxID=1421715 RepID=A0AAN7QDD7_9COLE|nr:hypothetical protein RN001_013683 [Aquatica leii]
MDARNYVAMPRSVLSVTDDNAERVASTPEPAAPSTPPCSSDESSSAERFKTVRRKSARRVVQKELSKAKKILKINEGGDNEEIVEKPIEKDKEKVKPKPKKTSGNGTKEKNRKARVETSRKNEVEEDTDAEPDQSRNSETELMDPEEIEIERLMKSYKRIMSLIPNNSNRITMEDKRVIRAELHEIKMRATLMIGVTKELRHRACKVEVQARNNPVQRTTTIARNYASVVKSNQEERSAPLPSRNEQATQPAKKKPKLFKMLQKGPSSSKTAIDVVSVAEEDLEHVPVISEPPPPSTPCSSDESCEEPKFTTVRRKSMRKIIKKKVAKAKKEINLIEVSEMDNVSEAKEAATVRPGIRKSRNSRDDEANKATTDSEPRSTREMRRSRVPEEDTTPEEIELKKLMASYKTIMSLIPNTSARITVEEKRIIRAELHEIKLMATLMIGVTKELRHRAKNSEAQAARTNVTQRVATATAPRNYAAAGPSCSSPTVSATEEDSEHVVLTSEPAPSTNCSSGESCAEAKFTTVRRKSSRKLIKKEEAKAKKAINLVETTDKISVREAKEAAVAKVNIRKTRNSRDKDKTKVTSDSEPHQRETRRSFDKEEDATPEATELGRLMKSYKVIMSLIPNNSSRITMEDKPIIRAELHEIKMRATLMIAVTKKLRHRAQTSEQARSRIAQRPATTTATRNYASVVRNVAQDQYPALTLHNEQPAQLTQKKNKTFKKSKA